MLVCDMLWGGCWCCPCMRTLFLFFGSVLSRVDVDTVKVSRVTEKLTHGSCSIVEIVIVHVCTRVSPEEMWCTHCPSYEVTNVRRKLKKAQKPVVHEVIIQ